MLQRIQEATAEEAAALLPELYRLREEKARRDPLSFFKPLPWQEPFVRSRARGRAIIAGNRAGKTHVGAAEALWRATGVHPHRPAKQPATFGWIISLDYTMQRDIIQPKLQQLIPPERFSHKTMRVQDAWDRIILTCGVCGKKPKKTGDRSDPEKEAWFCSDCHLPCSVIGMKSCDQGPQKFQGVALDWAWFDEEPPKDVFDEVMIRLIDKKGDWWLSMTPVNGQTWSYDSIYQPWEEKRTPAGDLEVFSASMSDNTTLDPVEVKRAEDAEPDEAMKAIRFHGTYSVVTGLIYKSWDPKVHEHETLPREFLDDEGKIIEDYDTYCGIDTGRHFAASLWLVDYFGAVWNFDEYYAEDIPLSVHARAIRSMCERWGVWPTFILDPVSQFFVDLADNGISCTLAQEEVLAGIGLMQDAMKIDYTMQHGYQVTGRRGLTPRLYVIRPNVPRFLRERKRYKWAKPPRTGDSAGAEQNKPVKKDDHMIDGARFVLQYRPPPSRPRAGDTRSAIEIRTLESVKKKLTDRESGRTEEEDSGD